MTERELSSLVSEDQLVGSCLMAPHESIFQIIEAGVKPEWFTQREAIVGFGLMVEMYLNKQEISLPTVIEYAGQKKKNFSMEYATRCIDVTPVRDIRSVLDKVKEMWMRRAMVEKSKELRNFAPIMDSAPGESIGKIICDLADLTATHKKQSLEEIKAALMGKYRAAAKGGVAGIPLPWPEVTAKLGGLQPGKVTVFAGRGGIGKSMCCANLALHLGNAGIPVGYIPFEDGLETTWGRVAGIEGRYSTFRLEQGRASMAEVNVAEQYIEKVMKLPIYMESRRMSAEEVMAWAIHQKSKNKIQVLIIDAFKDMSRKSRDTSEDDAMSQTICEIAARLNLAVWVDHHVRKDYNSKDGLKKLTTDDIRGSGNITNDARQVLVAQNWKDEGGVEHFSFDCVKSNSGPSGWSVDMDRQASINTWTEKQKPAENND